MAKFIKNLMLSELKRDFSNEKNLIFVTFKTLNAQKSRELRQIIRGSGSALKVVKNSIAKRVLQDLGYNDLDNYFKGETAIIKGVSDVIQLVKNLNLWNQKEKKLKIKGGILDKKLFAPETIESFSKLFGKKEAINKIHSSLKGQLFRLHWMFSSLLIKFTVNLKQYTSRSK